MEGGEVQPAYDTYIRGAHQLVPWVRENVPVTLQQIRNGLSFNRMLTDLADLIQPGDVIVAHNALFDMDTCIHTTAGRLERQKGYPVDWQAVNKILRTPSFCTMRCAWSKKHLGMPNMNRLCEHFHVDYDKDGAHEARYDSLKLAECVQEALRRGEMMDSTHMVAYHERAAGKRIAAQRLSLSPRTLHLIASPRTSTRGETGSDALPGRAPVSDASGSREPVSPRSNRWDGVYRDCELPSWYG